MFRRIAILALLATAPAHAASYEVGLGGRTIGTIEHAPGRLLSVLDNTPLGVGDGRYEGLISGGGDAVAYVGQSDERRIEIRFDGRAPAVTEITPPSERTPLSDPAAVPDGVVDPVRGFGIIAEAGDCPAAFRIYDGRRVVELTPESREISDGLLGCRMAYRVIAGPGHVSPFRIKSMELTAYYALSEGRPHALAGIAIRAGGFTLTLARQ